MTIAKRKHIALITSFRFIEYRGGAEKVLCDLANALSQKDYDITIIYSEQRNDGVPAYFINSKVRTINAWSKLPFHFIWTNPIRNIRSFTINKTRRRLKRQLLEAKWKSKSIEKTIRYLHKIDAFICFDATSTKILLGDLQVSQPVITMIHTNPSNFFSQPNFEENSKFIEKSAAIQILLPIFEPPPSKDIPEGYVCLHSKLRPKTKPTGQPTKPHHLHCSTIKRTKASSALTGSLQSH